MSRGTYAAWVRSARERKREPSLWQTKAVYEWVGDFNCRILRQSSSAESALLSCFIARSVSASHHDWLSHTMRSDSGYQDSHMARLKQSALKLRQIIAQANPTSIGLEENVGKDLLRPDLCENGANACRCYWVST